MNFNIGARGIYPPLVAFNFCMYAVTAALAGWALDKNIDAMQGKPGFVGNAATYYFLPMVLIACMVGLASALTGFHHLKVWRTYSNAAAVSVSLTAWTLSFLAFGVAIKQIWIGGPRNVELIVLEAFITILTVFELLYLLSLHAGFFYVPPPANAGVAGVSIGLVQAEKHHHGTPAAAAV